MIYDDRTLTPEELEKFNDGRTICREIDCSRRISIGERISLHGESTLTTGTVTGVNQTEGHIKKVSVRNILY